MPIEIRQVSGYEEPGVEASCLVATRLSREGEALIAVQIRAAKRAGVETLYTWARPWQHQDLYESLGYEVRTASVDFQGPLQ